MSDQTIRNMYTNPTEARPTERQLMWQRLELTAFFHFTVNTFTGKEWGKGTESPNVFQPTQLDCRQWIRSIKQAGFKLAILTAKHHDGFCLWQTAHTKHSVASSTWRDGKGDVLREFVDACKEYDILPGVYLSPWDRNHPDYGSAAYNDHFDAQLREVLTGYGPFYEVWFDGACAEGPNGKKQVYDWSRYYTTIRELAPQAVISICGPDIRWVGNEHGYGHKTEWNIVPEGHFDQIKIEEAFQEFHYEEKEGLETTTPAYNKYPNQSPSPQANGEKWAWYPSEVDVSIRPGWFYHKTQDRLVKSHARLVDIYYCSVGYGSGLLLNFPPDRRGLIHERDVKRLQAVATTLRATFATPVAEVALGGGEISSAPAPASATTRSVETSTASPTAPERSSALVPETVLANSLVSQAETSATPAPATQPEATAGSTKTADNRALCTLPLAQPATFDRIVLQEDIAQGQRVESFVVEYQSGRAGGSATAGGDVSPGSADDSGATADGSTATAGGSHDPTPTPAVGSGTWRHLVSGTTIGYKRILRTKKVKALCVRVRVTSTIGEQLPRISYMGLYKSSRRDHCPFWKRDK